jgi:hypothetical protein
MLNRNISPIVIRFLMILYCNQFYSVKWNQHPSVTFPVYNGVRQGAVCSPVLFCIYLDGLLLLLEKAEIGCYIGNCCLGALCYADDLTLLAPTADAMRTMLKLCEHYAYEHSITFKADKSKCIIFKPLSGTIHDEPSFSIAGKLIDHTSVAGRI